MSNSNFAVNLDWPSFQFIMQDLAQWMPKETGGILMGYRADAGLHVTHVIGPGPKAVHEAVAFTPDYAYHEAEVGRIYTETGGKVTYLGDWHTHPGAAAYMSAKDRQVLKRIAKHKEARLPEPLMLIVGTNPFEVKAWKYKPKQVLRPGVYLQVSIKISI